MVDVKQMLLKAIEHDASDVHINVTMPPMMRINTELIVMDDFGEVTNDNARAMVLEMTGQERYKKFEKSIYRIIVRTKLRDY